MNKTALFSNLVVSLFLIGFFALGQAPPAAPGDQKVIQATNREEIIRQLLNRAYTNPLPTTNQIILAPPAMVQPATNLAPATPAAAPGAPAAAPAAPQTPAPRPAPAAPPGLPLPSDAAQPPPGARPPPGIPATNVVTINFPAGAPLEQIFDLYAELSSRTILRPAVLAVSGPVPIKTQTPLTAEEAITALDSILALNNITMINVGDKFVKAVQSNTAIFEGTPFYENGERIREGDYFLTHIVRVKNAKPSEVAQVIQTLTKNPAGIIAVDSSGILVLRDLASIVKRMVEVIDRVDVVPELDYTFEVIPIKYGKVTELYDAMNSLISGTPAPSRPVQQPTQFRTPGGVGTSGQPGQPYNPLQGTQPGGAAASRTSFQDRLQRIVSRAAAGGELQVLANARIMPDERSNSLLIFASKQDFQMITNIVSKVDVLLAQVLIEAVVMEVNLDDSLDLGVSMLQRPQKVGNVLGGGVINNNASIATGRAFLDPSILATNLAATIPSDSGFSYFLQFGNELDVAVRAIATEGDVNIVSRPRLQTSHATPGSFFLGRSVPYVTGTYNYGFGFGGVGGIPSQSIINQLNVGIDLQVTPYITPDGLVVMDIYQNISELGGEKIIDGNPIPETTTKSVQSSLSVRDGDTIMLGGFINENTRKSNSGVPFLKDIPGLGALFRAKRDVSTRSELIVLLHVKVLDSPQEAAIVAREEKDKLYGIQRAEEEFARRAEKRRGKVEKERRR